MENGRKVKLETIRLILAEIWVSSDEFIKQCHSHEDGNLP